MLDSRLTNRATLKELIAEHHEHCQETRPETGRVRAVVGLVTGCFDLLHRGHVELLEAAGMRCTMLIVALNDDASVHRLKGKGYPLVSLEDRAALIYAIGHVDYVTSFPEGTPSRTIEIVRPDLYFKGADYALEELLEGQVVEKCGGRIVLLPFTPGYSSTMLRHQILETRR